MRATPLALLLALASGPSHQDPSERDPTLEPPLPRLTAADARADLALLWKALDIVHPGLERYTSRAELEEARNALAARLESGVGIGTFYRELSLLCARIRCGHTRVEAPPALEEYRRTHATHLPFAFRLVEGRMLVMNSVTDVALPRGTEVLAIDGVTVPELVARIGPAMVLDGWTDHARASRLDTSYEFEDCGLDHYLPLFHGFRPRFALRVRALPDGPERELEVPAIPLEDALALQPASARDFRDGVQLEFLDDDTALLTVETFVNYRDPVDPEALFARLFGELAARGVEHLVIDLRSCGGGSGDVGWTLGRFLAREPFDPQGRLPRVKNIRFGDLVEHLSTWADDAFEMPEEAFRRLDDGRWEVLGEVSAPLLPHPARFQGRISVLIGPFIASGTTMLLAVLREHADLGLVGQPTAGSAEGPTAGLIFFLTLPASGIRVNVPVLDQRTSAHEFEPGMGVAPDVLVPDTIADVLAGRDAVLETALRR